MKLFVLRSAIHDTLGRLSRIITVKSTMPVLGHILLRAEPSGLSLAATNLEMDARAPVPADIEEGGTFTVPGDRLASIVAALGTDARISLETEADRLVVKSGRARYNLTTLGADGFPDWAASSAPTHGFVLPAKDLFRVVSTVAKFSMADDKTQYNLVGVHLECRDGKLIAMATDAKRMVYADTSLEGIEPVAMLLSASSVRELLPLLDKIGGDVAVSFNKAIVAFKFEGEFTLTCRLVDATFPAQANTIINAAEGNPHAISVDGAAFSAMISRLMAMASGTSAAVWLTLENGVMRAEIRHPEHGEAKDEIECEYEGPELKVGFQIQYLRQLAETLDADTLEIRIKDPNTPTFWRRRGDASVKFVQLTRVGTGN